MDIEFHYYMTYIIARRAGFSPNDSSVIAYSSQYTDDNTEHLYISQDTPDAYESYISQTVNILKPQKELMRIYPVFHEHDSQQLERSEGSHRGPRPP